MYFKYKAFKNGKTVDGKIEADTVSEVTEYLRTNGYFPIKIEAIKMAEASLFAGIFDRVSFNDIVNLTRQLAIMLNAGLTLIDCFEILRKQITKVGLLKIVEDLDKEVKGGSPLSSALKQYPEHFSNLYISLVKSGEASGKLSEILLKLADNLEKQREFQSKIKGALIYPLIVVIAMLGVMFIMITFVIPKLLGLYKDFNIELPLSTQILIIVSGFFSQFWPIIIIAVGVSVYFGKAYIKTKTGKKKLDQLMLKMPIVSNVIKMSNLVDSTRTLAILIAAGVSILDALDIVTETSSNIVYHDAFASIYQQVEKGSSIGSAMTKEGVFPPILIQMTIVGEQTGHLDDTLLRIANYFEMESTMAVKSLTTLIEPAILVVLGLGVGVLVMSVITPIYNLTSSLK